MADKYIIRRETLYNIAKPVRELSGVENELTPAQISTKMQEANVEIENQSELLDQAIADLEIEVNNINGEVSAQSNLLDQVIANLNGKIIGENTPVIESLEITENGEYIAPDGVDGYSPINVNVAASGLPEGVSKIASGLYQPTSDRTTAVDIAHGLGVKPDFCWWILEDDVSTSPSTNTTVIGCYTEKAAIYSNSLKTPYSSHYFMLAYNSSSALQRTAQSVEAAAFTETTCRIMANAQYRLKAGCTYRWVCGVLG